MLSQRHFWTLLFLAFEFHFVGPVSYSLEEKHGHPSCQINVKRDQSDSSVLIQLFVRVCPCQSVCVPHEICFFFHFIGVANYGVNNDRIY